MPAGLKGRPIAWCICGRSDAIGGRTHTCRHPDGPRWSEVNPHKSSPNGPIAPLPSPNRPVEASPNSGASRNARWRAKNRDHYNAGMRELMRRKRAAQSEQRKGDGLTPMARP
jgi:hypothetical protein